MITSINQANEEFFRIFFGTKVKVDGELKNIPCRYAKKSSNDYVEADNQSYPCIAIQDYIPTPKEEWFVDMYQYFGAESLDGLSGFLFQRPIWMNFRYDVSIATKRYKEYMALQDYFLQNFVYGKRFIFNKKLSGIDEVGDIVPYEITSTDIPRSDGIFETNYEFNLSVWLHVRTPEEVELVRDIVIKAYPHNLE